MWFCACLGMLRDPFPTVDMRFSADIEQSLGSNTRIDTSRCSGACYPVLCCFAAVRARCCQQVEEPGNPFGEIENPFGGRETAFG